MTLHQYTKNHDHMMFSCRAMAWTGVILDHFCHFIPRGV